MTYWFIIAAFFTSACSLAQESGECEIDAFISVEAKLLSDDLKNNSSLLGYELYEKFLRLSEQDTHKVYKKISNAHKKELWNTHLTNVIKNEVLSESQYQFIELLKEHLDIVFPVNKNTWLENNLVKPQIKDFENASKRILGQELAYKALVDLRAYSVDFNEVNPPRLIKPNAVSMCSCSSESDWCVFSDCDNGGCSQSFRSCGTWWGYECNGGCR
jgi:hypothetical protein